MVVRALHQQRLLVAILAGLWLAGCAPRDRAPRIVDGYLTPAQADQIVQQWPDTLRDQLLRYVYSVDQNRYVRACGEDPVRPLPAVRLAGDGFRLLAHHGDDLSCALAEADVFVLAERGAGVAGFTTLVAVVGGERVVEIEVERSARGVVQQVYGLYAPDLRHRLVLRPRPPEAPMGDGLVIEQSVTAHASLNAIRALLGRASFDLSAVGVGGLDSAPRPQAVALGDDGSEDRR
ncbi:MAG: hypothetical protein AAGA68_10755 [Pseudomonadota bacterium]